MAPEWSVLPKCVRAYFLDANLRNRCGTAKRRRCRHAVNTHNNNNSSTYSLQQPTNHLTKLLITMNFVAKALTMAALCECARICDRHAHRDTQRSGFPDLRC